MGILSMAKALQAKDVAEGWPYAKDASVAAYKLLAKGGNAAQLAREFTGKLPAADYENFQDMNYHALNEALVRTGKFEKLPYRNAEGPYSYPYGTFAKDYLSNMPASIPGIGPLATGLGMAGVAGAGLGAFGNWALRQYGSTLVLKQQAESAQQIARALEAAHINSLRD